VTFLIRRRALSPLFALVLLGSVIGGFFVFRGLDSRDQAAVAPTSAKAFVPEAEYAEHSPHVASQLDITGIQGAVRGEPAVPAPDQPPVPAASFTEPVAAYIRYSVAQLTIMQGEITTLRHALQSGDRAASKAAWEQTWSRYLRLGGVYLEGKIAALNQAIDGGASGLSGGTSSPKFTGLHRIEFGLWTGEPPQSLVRYTVGLGANVTEMSRLLPDTRISPLDFATRTHEILEDAVRDLLSGEDVPWSHAGVLGTQAGVYATRELITTLQPLLIEPTALKNDPPANPRSPAVADADLNVLQEALNSLADAHGGRLPDNDQLTQEQSERLDAAIGQALEGLAQIPGMLETKNPAATPHIPSSHTKGSG
jgi:iron uptake system EfeUOB component EfeO/EfeM